MAKSKGMEFLNLQTGLLSKETIETGKEMVRER